MRSIMIIEPATAGHRMQYARRLIAAAINHDLQASLLTSRDAVDHPAYTDLAREYNFDDRFATAILPTYKYATSNSNIKKQLGYYLTIKSYFNDLCKRPDYVFVPYLEAMDHAISVLGSPFDDIPWSGILMKTAFHFKHVGVMRPNRPSDVIKSWSFHKLLRSRGLSCLFTIDPTLPSYMYNSLNPIHYVADPHDLQGAGSRDDIRAKLGITAGTVVVLAYGDFTASAERKGLDSLIAAAADDNCPRNVVIMVAGAQAESVIRLLHGPLALQLRRDGRLLERPYFHSMQEEYEVFTGADIVWAGYRGHYWMSGVMIQAGAAKLPIIATKQGLIGWFASQYKLGPAVNIDDISAVVSVVRLLAQSREHHDAYGVSGKRLADTHTVAAFGDSIMTHFTNK